MCGSKCLHLREHTPAVDASVGNRARERLCVERDRRRPRSPQLIHDGVLHDSANPSVGAIVLAKLSGARQRTRKPSADGVLRVGPRHSTPRGSALQPSTVVRGASDRGHGERELLGRRHGLTLPERQPASRAKEFL